MAHREGDAEAEAEGAGLRSVEARGQVIGEVGVRWDKERYWSREEAGGRAVLCSIEVGERRGEAVGGEP